MGQCEETKARERLEGSLGERRAELEKQLRQFDKDLGERISVSWRRRGKVGWTTWPSSKTGSVASLPRRRRKRDI